MPRYEPIDWYDEALCYDIIFNADTSEEADFLEAVHARHGRTGGRGVLEPACGTGRLVAALAERGWRVTGFDIADGSLEFARRRLRERGVHADLRHARLERFAFRQRFDLAHCLVSTFKYLLNESTAEAHLKCVAAALKPGGVYVLGLHLTDYADRGRNRERWVADRDGIEVVCNIQGWPANRRSRTERVRSRLTVREGDIVRRFETNWTFRTYSLRQLRALLGRVPQLEHVATYDFNHDIEGPVPLDGEQLDVVLVLRRR
jgi:SAM-dependent methyltransferase